MSPRKEGFFYMINIIMKNPSLIYYKDPFVVYNFNIPEEVQIVISFLLFSFDNKSATHLVPFPQAPETLPSEL